MGGHLRLTGQSHLSLPHLRRLDPYGGTFEIDWSISFPYGGTFEIDWSISFPYGGTFEIDQSISFVPTR